MSSVGGRNRCPTSQRGRVRPSGQGRGGDRGSPSCVEFSRLHSARREARSGGRCGRQPLESRLIVLNAAVLRAAARVSKRFSPEWKREGCARRSAAPGQCSTSTQQSGPGGSASGLAGARRVSPAPGAAGAFCGGPRTRGPERSIPYDLCHKDDGNQLH